MRHHHEVAVAAQRHTGRIGPGKPCAQDPVHAEAHRAKTPAVQCVPGVRGFQYCSDQTWQLPTSSTITVSGGEILFISAMMRRGSMALHSSVRRANGPSAARRARQEGKTQR